jgi:hypothetical protein
MHRMPPRIALAAIVALAVAAVPAFAADHDITLSSAKTKAEWEGAAQLTHGLPVYSEDARTAVPCATPGVRPCETVLIKVEDAGKLTVKVEGIEGTGGTTDPDLYAYKSDASGTKGDKLATGAVSGPDTVSIKAPVGYYLIEVDIYHGYNSGYKGVASLSGTAPAVAPVIATPPVTAPHPPATTSKPKPAAKKKPSCKAKAKKIKNAKKRKAALKRCAKKAKKN